MSFLQSCLFSEDNLIVVLLMDAQMDHDKVPVMKGKIEDALKGLIANNVFSSFILCMYVIFSNKMTAILHKSLIISTITFVYKFANINAGVALG